MTRISKANKYLVASLLLLGPRSGRRTPVDLKRLRRPICSNWDRFTFRFVLLYSNFRGNRPQKRLAIKVPTKGSQRIERQAVNAFNGKALQQVGSVENPSALLTANKHRRDKFISFQ